MQNCSYLHLTINKLTWYRSRILMSMLSSKTSLFTLLYIAFVGSLWLYNTSTPSPALLQKYQSSRQLRGS